ncbi:MAG: AMP-binding protein [Thermodesulfobacteriota bacterium]|nr:AMP-binding protein [Thermodesulfobacteriota bacterium]
MKRVHQPRKAPSRLKEIALSDKTLPILFEERAENNPEKVAFRYKDMGIYKEVTWREYWNEVEEFSLGLKALGLKKGDRVAIMGDPCPEWLYADMAIIGAGAISFGVYSTSSPEETCYTVARVEATLFIAEHQEYVDKILPFVDRFPFLLKIIVIDTRATFMYRHPRLISFSDVQKLGRKRKAEKSDEFPHLIGQIHSDDPAFLVFTSGTTGSPKPATITHRAILSSFIYAFWEFFPRVWSHEQKSVSHLSLAHIVERSFSIYFPLCYDWIPHIGEEIEYLQETIFEVQPTVFHGVPRIWEKFSGQILVGIESSSWIKKMSYHIAMYIGWKYIQMKWSRKKIPIIWRLLYFVAAQISFRHILHQVGLKRAEYVITTGAPMPPKIQQLWQIWGLDLINLYGSTEASGILSCQQTGFPMPGDMGKPPSVNKIKLADDGELLVSGTGVFAGYWEDEEKTNEVIKDGWLHMGEVFEYNKEGNLRMIDRKKDIMITSGGKNLSPTFIENAIKASPYISEVVVFADGRKFPSALIEIDFNTVAEWARRNKVLYTGFTSLAENSEVRRFIGEEVRKGNQTLARVEQVKEFRIIPQELDPEAGETTPTRKIKRGLMYEMFGDLVEDMYSSGEAKILESQMKTKNRQEG